MSVVIGIRAPRGDIWLAADRRIVGSDGRKLPARRKLFVQPDDASFCVGVVGDARLLTLLDQHIEDMGTYPAQFAEDVRQLFVTGNFQPARSQGAPTYPFGAVLTRGGRLYVIDGSLAVYESEDLDKTTVSVGSGAPYATGLLRGVDPFMSQPCDALRAVLNATFKEYPSCGDGADIWRLGQGFQQ